MDADGFDKRREQMACCADPARERGAIEVDALAAVDLRLPIERQRVGIFGDQNMGQQAGTSDTAVDGPGRCRSLHDPVAAVAAQLRADVADDLETCPDVLQHLGGIFAQFTQPAAAAGAGSLTGQMGVDLARQMLWQRAAEGLRGNGSLCRRNRSLLLDSLGRAELFQLQLQLLDLPEDLLPLRSRRASAGACRPAA